MTGSPARLFRTAIAFPLLPVLISVSFAVAAAAQDLLKTMPGYQRFHELSGQINDSVRTGALRVTWKDGGAAFEYQKDGKKYRFDIASLTKSVITNTSSDDSTEEETGRRGRRR